MAKVLACTEDEKPSTLVHPAPTIKIEAAKCFVNDLSTFIMVYGAFRIKIDTSIPIGMTIFQTYRVKGRGISTLSQPDLCYGLPRLMNKGGAGCSGGGAVENPLQLNQ
jgi:hypothetical protein